MTRHRLLLGAGSLLVFIGLSSFDLRGSADQIVSFPQGPAPQQPSVRDRSRLLRWGERLCEAG